MKCYSSLFFWAPFENNLHAALLCYAHWLTGYATWRLWCIKNKWLKDKNLHWWWMDGWIIHDRLRYVINQEKQRYIQNTTIRHPNSHDEQNSKITGNIHMFIHRRQQQKTDYLRFPRASRVCLQMPPFQHCGTWAPCAESLVQKPAPDGFPCVVSLRNGTRAANVEL